MSVEQLMKRGGVVVMACVAELVKEYKLAKVLG
jgi:hypothetical protein